MVKLHWLNFKQISDLELIKIEGKWEPSGQNATNWEKHARVFITIDAFLD